MTGSPQIGDFAVVRVKSRTGRLIRIGQWLDGGGFADFEHAFIYVGDGEIVEAEPGGARVGQLVEYAGEPVLWSTGLIPLTTEQRLVIVTAARRYLKAPYGFLDYLALAVHRLKLPFPGIRRRVESSRTMICSQLVDQCYKDAGADLFLDGRWPGYVTPADLRNLLVSKSHAV